MTLAARRIALVRTIAALAAACLLPSAQGADVAPVAWPAARAGDHVRYQVRECTVRLRDNAPGTGAVPAPRCSVRDIDLSVLSVDADGRARTRWIAKGTPDDYPVAALEQSDFLARRAVALGMPVDLVIDAVGEASFADLAAQRASVSRFAESLAGAPTRADAAQVRRLVQHVAATSDTQLLTTLAISAKVLFVARSRPLVPEGNADDVQVMDQDMLPIKVELARHVAASALSADGQQIRQTTTRTLDGPHAALVRQTLVDSIRGQGTPSPRDEADIREFLAAPLAMTSTVVTTIDLRSPWPTTITQVMETDFMHARERREQTWTRQ